MSSVSTAKKRTNFDDALKKRIPENPRFRNVKPVVNTGMNSRSQVPQRVKDAQKHQRQDEIFKRIRLSTFVALMVEVAKEELDLEQNKSTNEHLQPKKQVEVQSPKSNSVLSGFGELDLKSGSDNQKAESRQNNNVLSSLHQDVNLKLPPYLLLDVRDPDLFEASHIITAKNYPAPMLSRTCNYESRDLLLYKNVPLNIIVIYDEDETISSRVATTLTQRGYDNIFVLTGGLKLATSKFMEGLIIKGTPRQFSAQSHSRYGQLTSTNKTEVLTSRVVESLQSQLTEIVTTSSQSANGQSVSGYQSRASTAQTKQSITRSAMATHSGRVKPWK